MPGFGVLVLIFLFGVALIGFGRSGSSNSTNTTTFGSGFNLTNGANGITPVGGWNPIPGAVVGDADNGSSVTLKRPDEGLLVLADRRGAPRVTGDVVRLRPVPGGDRAGVDEWWIVPVRPGTAAVTAKQFRVTVSVR